MRKRNGVRSWLCAGIGQKRRYEKGKSEER